MANNMPIHKIKAGFHLWSHFKRYWRDTPRLANVMLVAAIAITGSLQILALVGLNYWNKLFFNSLQAYDTSKLPILGFFFIAILLMISLSYAFNNYFSGLFSLKWRVYLTRDIKNKWLTQQRYDRLQKLMTVDNPEQRITDDLNLMPKFSISIVNQIFQSSITLVIFGYELWVFSKAWGVNHQGHMLTMPGIYLWSTLIYAAIFNVLIFTLGHKLINLNYINQKLTATFRYIMSLIREYSQKIALQRLESEEQEKTDLSFNGIVSNALAILRIDRTIQFIRQISINSGGIFILLIALPAYFTYHLQLGYLMQINGAAIFFIKGLSVLIDAYEDIAQLRASEQRVTELTLALEAMAPDENLILQTQDNPRPVLSNIV